jgi:acetyltransferase-like isoleucine patch superfamily enzyme
MVNEFDFNGWLFDRLFSVRNKCNILFFNTLIHFVCKIKGVRTGRNVIYNGFPIVRRHENSIIFFGDGCRFNSARRSVLIGVQKPCTFVTLQEKSEIVFGNNSGATGSTIVAAKKVKIGNNVMIGANSIIMDTDFHHADPGKRHMINDVPAKPVIIEDNVFIGLNSFILKGVTIGENSVIGANSVVMDSIPKNAIAIGNPCKVIIIKKWDLPVK